MAYPLQSLIDNMLALVDEKPERELTQSHDVALVRSVTRLR